MKRRIAIDMDETVTDTLDRRIDWYHRDFGVQFKRSDTVGGKLRHIVPPEHAKIVKNYLSHPDFFKDLPVKEGAIDAIHTLSEHYAIYFVTAAMEFPSSFNVKFAWLQKHFGFIDQLHYVFCGKKDIINADYLIDDTPKHLDMFEGHGLLFSAEHNMKVQGYDRVDTWPHVVQKILG